MKSLLQGIIIPILPVVLLAAACCAGAQGGKKPVGFQLQNYENSETAKGALARELPQGTSREKVMRLLKESQIPCFDTEAKVLACRVIEPSSTMVHVVWQLAFHFDERKQLERIDITRGLVGP
jgi:hypothetical protein